MKLTFLEVRREFALFGETEGDAAGNSFLFSIAVLGVPSAACEIEEGDEADISIVFFLLFNENDRI